MGTLPIFLGMSIYEMAIRDWKKFSQQREATFIDADGVEATVQAMPTSHWMSLGNSDGVDVDTKNAHIAVSEKLLTDEGYTTRNASGEISMLGHVVKWKDARGVEGVYTVRQTYPSNTVGIIVIILEDHEI